MSTTILDGYLKAMKFLAEAPGKGSARRKPRYSYEPFALALHAKRCLRPDEIALRAQLVEKLRTAAQAYRQAVINEMLSKLPLDRVKIRQAVRIERSRYSGRAIKALGAQGGKKQQARAAARAAAMRAASPSAINDNAARAQTEAA